VAGRGVTPAERRAWRGGVYALIIQAMTRPQGKLAEAVLPIVCARRRQPRELLPVLASLGAAPGETALRDAVQRLALARRHYGHRRISALRRRAGWCVNPKRVLRLMREDNLLCLRRRTFVPPTIDSRHGWRIYPNLVWRLRPSALELALSRREVVPGGPSSITPIAVSSTPAATISGALRRPASSRA
jgi:hypothetical protein